MGGEKADGADNGEGERDNIGVIALHLEKSERGILVERKAGCIFHFFGGGKSIGREGVGQLRWDIRGKEQGIAQGAAAEKKQQIAHEP